jgi:hypothetical protein
LHITYTYGVLGDAWVKKDKHLENQKCYMDPSNIFDFPNVHPFSPRGFFTFLVNVAHGAPPLPSLWLVGPPKTALLIYNNYLEDESIFLPRNEHDFFTAASTTSWGITKLRRELCQNALLPINKSKLSALFIIFFFEGGLNTKRRERLHCFKFIQ